MVENVAKYSNRMSRTEMERASHLHLHTMPLCTMFDVFAQRFQWHKRNLSNSTTATNNNNINHWTKLGCYDGVHNENHKCTSWGLLTNAVKTTVWNENPWKIHINLDAQTIISKHDYTLQSKINKSPTNEHNSTNELNK